MSWVQTRSGRAFDLKAPDPEAVRVDDIAWALSMTARYNGHTSHFYSVAEHCVLMHDWFMGHGKTDLARVALIHDAAEAYIGDMPSPIKRILPGWSALERRVERVVSSALGLDLWHPEVKGADMRILLDERAQLMCAAPVSWGPVEDLEPLGVSVLALSPKIARKEWLARWDAF